jgi:hypothetical protein
MNRVGVAGGSVTTGWVASQAMTQGIAEMGMAT